MTYGPATLTELVEDGTFPPTTRVLSVEDGTIGNASFLAIPASSPDQAGAMVVADLALSPEQQVAKADPDVWGQFTVLDTALLEDDACTRVRPVAGLTGGACVRRAVPQRTAGAVLDLGDPPRRGLATRGPRSPMTSRRVSGVAPGIVAITVVAGTGMAAVVATSIGLMPLYGEPVPSLDGWRSAAPDLVAGIGESLLIAVPATVLAALVGFLLATLMLGGGRAAGVVRVACLAVLAVPHLVGATSVLLLLGDGGVAARVVVPAGDGWPALVGGPWPVATVLELAWKESAFVALVVLAAVAPGHRMRMQVAAGLGARPVQRILRVLLPTAAPAVGAASLVTLVYAIGSYEVAWLLGRTVPEPLPVLAFRLFGSIELTDRPAAAAAAVTGSVLALCVAVPALAALPRLRALSTEATS